MTDQIDFRSVIDNLGIAIVILKQSGEIIHSNPLVTKTFRTDNLTLKNNFFTYLKHLDPRVDIAPQIERVISTNSFFETELVFDYKDSESFYVRIIFSPMAEYALGVFFDVTQMRKTEKLKYDFIATVSHELRTPLSVIAETLNLLKTERTGKLNEKQSECVDLADRNRQRLARLVDNVLDTVKIEGGHFQVDIGKVLLEPLIINVIKAFNPIFSKKGLNLLAKIDKQLPPVMADEDRIAQVLANLINNAYKYTRDGEVAVSAFLKGENVEVVVEDTGLGISKDNLNRIFLKYQQIKQNDKSKPPEKGSGLGLFIVKSIITEHSGEIWVNSELGKGTAFHFTIPVYNDK